MVILKESWLHYKTKIITKYNLSRWEIDSIKRKNELKTAAIILERKMLSQLSSLILRKDIALAHALWNLIKVSKNLKIDGFPPIFSAGDPLSRNLRAGRSWTAALLPSPYEALQSLQPKEAQLTNWPALMPGLSIPLWNILAVAHGRWVLSSFSHRFSGTFTKNSA